MREMGLEPTQSGSLCVRFIVLPLSPRAKDCDRCWGERWRQSETPGVLSAGSPALCFAGEVRLTLHCLCHSGAHPARHCQDGVCRAHWRRMKPSPASPLTAAPGPGRPPAGPGGPPRSAGGALPSLSVVAWQRCTPASPGTPALLFTLQTVKRSMPQFRGQGAAASGLRAVQACLSVPGPAPAHAPRGRLPRN